ncbi:hypothetical protein L4D77_18675 [Photobacterium frigidiphilum]
MASTLTVHHYDNDKAALVNATTPLKGDGQAFWYTDMLSALGDVQLLSKVLSRLEQGRGLPVLLRQYLGLKGKLVCFNVDPAFNDAYRRRSSSVRATSPRKIHNRAGRCQPSLALGIDQL